MRAQRKTLWILLLCLGLAAASAAATGRDGPFALTGCRIVPVAGPPIEEGTLVIRDGMIAAIGAKKDVPVPPDADVIDVSGMTAYPGFIDAHSNIFIDPPKPVPVDPLRAAYGLPGGVVEKGLHGRTSAFDLLNPNEKGMQQKHKSGIAAALAAPIQGIFAGRSVLLNLNGKDAAGMVVRNDIALHINFAPAQGTYPSTVMGVMALIRQTSLDAAAYQMRKEHLVGGEKGIHRPAFDPHLESLLPYFHGKNPVVFTCRNKGDIRRAVRLIDECGLTGIISGANEAWQVVPVLHSSGSPLPLLISLSFTPPRRSYFSNRSEEARKKEEEQTYPANPAELHKQGFRFALTSLGLSAKETFLGQLKKAVKAGLPAEQALLAVTKHPAEFLGVDSMLGTLEVGKIANVVLFSGDAFAESSKVKEVFVDGIRFSYKDEEKDK